MLLEFVLVRHFQLECLFRYEICDRVILLRSLKQETFFLLVAFKAYGERLKHCIEENNLNLRECRSAIPPMLESTDSTRIVGETAVTRRFPLASQNRLFLA